MSSNGYSLRGRVVAGGGQARLTGLRVVATDRTTPDASVLVDATTDDDGRFELAFPGDAALALLSAATVTTAIWDSPVVLHLSAYDGDRRVGTWTRTTTARALLSGGSLDDLEVEAVATPPNASLTARVRTPAGEPIPGLDVVLERIDLSGRARAGRGTTDLDGAAAFVYPIAPQGTRAATGVRLQITVSADGRDLARSAVLFGLADGQEVAVVIDDERRATTELDRLRSAAARVVDDATLTRLDPEQFEMVAADADVYPPHLATWIAARRLVAGTRVDASHVYGLARIGVPLDPASLFVHAEATYADALRRAVQRRIIPDPRGGIDAAGRTLAAAMREAASQRIVSAEPRQVTPSWAALRASGLGAERLQAFTRRWLALEGPSAARWAALRADPEFQRDADLLEFTADVSSAVGHHQPVVEALVAERRSGRVPSLRSLASWSVERWTDVLRGRGLPPALGELPADEGLRRYAETAARVVEAAFPTAVLAERLAEAELFGAAAIRRMVRSEPDFDLDRTVIARFVAEHPDAVPESDRERVVAGLSLLQRVHGLTRGLHRSDITRALLRRGIGSAAEVVRLGQASFVRRFSADLDGLDPQRGGEQVARDVFARARVRHGAALAWASTFTRAFQGTPMTVLPSFELTGDDPEAASLRTLFGSLDFCACEHCRSMFSPAAYLVDLLSFLEVRPAEDDQDALSVLRRRRGDLAGIELSCVNTTTEMPYVDLVLELLEQLAVDVDAPLAPRQTTRAAAELRVQPEHRLDPAYDRTAEAVFPWSLPFDLSGLRVRAGMAQLGVPRSEAMAKLGRSAPAVEPPAMDAVAESLGLAPQALQIITAATAYPLDEFPALPGDAAWGMPDNLGWVTALAADVGQLIRRARLSVLDLIARLGLPFVAPDGGIAVEFDPPTSCDLADASVEGLDADVLDRLHRFLRLGRAVALTPVELDRAIAQLGGGTLDAEFARGLVDHLAVMTRLRRPSDLVLSLWHPLDTRRRGGTPSPYELLFQNRVSTPELDPAFALAGDDLPAAPLSENHFATIRAALGVNDADLRRLIAEALPANPPPLLSVDTLSALHRHVLLARATSWPVSDLLRLLHILPPDPFDDPAGTLMFLDTLDPIKKAKLSIAELDYVLRHQEDETDPVDLGDQAIDDMLTAIAAAVAQGDAPIDAIQGELVDVVAAHLGAVLPGPIDVSAWMAILAMESAAIGPAELAILEAGLTGVVGDPAGVAQEIAGTAPGAARLTLVSDVLVGFRRRQVRESALVTVMSERLQLEPAAARALLFDIVHEGGLAASDLLLPGGGEPSQQRRGVRRLHKGALVVRGLGVETPALGWFFGANQSVRGLDLDALPLDAVDDGSPHFLGFARVQLGQSLRGSLADPSALEQAAAATDLDAAVDILATATGWNAADISFVLGPGMLDVEPPGLEDPHALATVRAAVDLVRRTGVAAERLAGWARQRATPAMATDVLAALRSRYDDATWPAVFTPIADRFRTAQRDALIDLLIGRGDFSDAIALYNRLLVDPLMEPCMLTSRIRLAMSAAQLFIQRALMRLEDAVELTPNDAEQWEWMKNYRVWEANRKVFFYPENWVEPELRDDKSPFFRELERHLSQAELDDDYVEAGYKDYLRKLHEVSHLEVPALVRDASGAGDKPVVHVLGRTRGLPMTYYYRARVNDAYWTPWTKVPVDIPTDQVTLATHNRRLFALWAEAQEEAVPGLSGSGGGVKENEQGGLLLDLGGETPPEPPPKILRVRIGWTEYRDGAWAPKKITPLSEAHSEAVDHYAARHLCIVAFERVAEQMLFVDVLARKGRTSKAIATFRYDDCRDVLEERPVTDILYEPRDLGMGDGTVADRQRDHPLVGTSLPDEALDLPRWDATAKNYDSPPFLENLPHEYWVTPARQSELYTGRMPVVFDDEDRAFYIVPQLVEAPSPEGITPGADPWESYALLPAQAPEPSAISLARAGRRASATGPTPWSGTVPGLVHVSRGLARDADTHSDAVLAWADAHAVLPAGSATAEIAIAPAPIGATELVWG
jgi:hypothetical protein